jgi:uncharacterized membrane protein YfbV (UPF0208 family)
VDDHPIRLTVDDDLRRSRLTAFFRLLLAIPHFIWFGLWSIAVVFAAIVTWFAALVKGRAPQGLHDFLAAYVRYATHLDAYMSFAANPYPSFTGEPGYPVDVEIPGPQPQGRWKIALRILLAIPALALAAAVGWGLQFGGGGAPSDESTEATAVYFRIGGAVGACAFLGWFVAVVLGRASKGLRDLAAYGVGYGAQGWAYALLLTDRYPNSDPDELGPAWSLPPHPVWLELDDDGARSRLTVLFRLLLALPHFVWLTLWSIAAILAAIANWFVALVRGRSAEPLHRFLAAYIRYSAHVIAFVFVVANPFPGFTGAPGYPVDIAIAPTEPQNRWVTLFRLFLAVPAFLVGSALSGVLFAVGFLGWFAALVTGRMPTGLRNLGAMAIRYQAQTDVYFFVLHDRYPYSSPALRPPPEPEPEWAPEPEPLEAGI